MVRNEYCVAWAQEIPASCILKNLIYTTSLIVELLEL